MFIFFGLMNIRYYRHWISIYLGLFCSIGFSYFFNILNVDISTDSPPGEEYFDLFLAIILFSFLQLIILLCLNGITSIIKKLTQRTT